MPTAPATERRYRPRAELRVEPAAGKPAMLVGYAVVYNALSEDLCGFREVIKPGAFTESLRTADVRALVDHDPSLLLGRAKSGTLRLFDEDKGLRVEVDLPDTSYARDLAESVSRQDMDGMSFGFIALEDEWGQTEDGTTTLRTITRADIFDVSAVSYPAYPETTLALRSLDRWKQARGEPSAAEIERIRMRLYRASFR